MDEDRDDDIDREDVEVNEANEDVTPTKSSVKKKMSKIKEERDDEEAKRLLEQQLQ